MSKALNSVAAGNKADLVKRLRYIEGHVRAVATMVEKDSYCMDILDQSHAVIEAMKKVNSLILEGYLGECVLDAKSSNPTKRKEAVKELIKIYTKK
ncbi:MAG TPA: metal-sensitive transcriptional regulator [Patescibacteria group bacterium]|jgi:DNA-binding FrmR family transcriptional regulator|nr:metal-sensitive transcriptional regulator [Patescibacteria group bacterium]